MTKMHSIQGIEPDGALSSDYVSKLVSKEVSKRLRNFIPLPYDGRVDLRTNVAKRARIAS